MTLHPSLAGAPIVPDFITLAAMTPIHAHALDTLHAEAFGPGRFARTAFRLRERASPLTAYSFVAERGAILVGAVSTSRIRVGETDAVLLGPLAVRSTMRELGIGKALLAKAVASAFGGGEAFVILVGDLPYYAPAGFQRVPVGTMQLPGPVDPARLLIAINPARSDAASSLPRGDVTGH